ncbi:hypothetical protein KBD09_02490 [Candidatus Woesebacteria bacterium]|nr:hypothetical protein [Candidatus Woesebacteria bacterium]
MDSLEKAHQYLRHTRIAIWAIILFLGVVVYLMVTLSQQVSNEEAMDFRSRASEYTISAENSGTDSTLRIDSQDSEQNNQTAGLACAAYYKSFQFTGGTPPNQHSGTCTATYECNNGCGCPSEEKVVTCRGSYSPMDPNKKVQCDWNDCAAKAKALCIACAPADPIGGGQQQPPQASPTPLPTITPLPSPTPQAPCCTISGTAEGRVVAPGGEKQVCKVMCGHLTYYPQKFGGGWTDATCKAKADVLCPKQCDYHKIPLCPAP